MTTRAVTGLVVLLLSARSAFSAPKATPPATPTTPAAPAPLPDAPTPFAPAEEPTVAPLDAPPPPAPLPPLPPPPPEPADEPRQFVGSVQADYLGVVTRRTPASSVFDGTTAEVSLRVTRDFGEHASATVKACFACHGFELALGYIELRANDGLRVRAGRIIPAFGAFPQRHDPANHLTSDKPLPYDMGRMLGRVEWNEGILPAPWVDNGVEVSGAVRWRGGQLDYAASMTGGPKGGPDASDLDFTLSRSPAQYYVDNNDEPTLGGRVAVTLDVADDITATAGASMMTGHYDPARTLGFMIGGADLTVHVGRVFVRAEYLLRRTEMALGSDPAAKFKYGPGASGRYDPRFVKDGFYVEGEVPVGRLTLLARFDGLRRLGNVVRSSVLSSASQVLRYTVGLATPLTGKVILKASLEAYQFDDLPDELATHLGVATTF